MQQPPGKKSNTALKVVLAAVLGVLLLAGGCAVIAVVAGNSSDYSDSTRTTFIDSCNEDAGGSSQARRLCACTYRWFEDNVPYERFREIDENLDESPNTTPPPELQRAIKACD